MGAKPWYDWVFRWRRAWDSNPRTVFGRQTISSRSRYDLFDSPPYISTVFRALRKCKKNTQEQYEILKFDPAKTLINQGFSAEKTARANAHFECCTFDHSDNSPCLFSSGFLSGNLLKNSLERKQERRQKIFDFEIFCVEEHQGEAGGRKSQVLPKFRVFSTIMTFVVFSYRFQAVLSARNHSCIKVFWHSPLKKAWFFKGFEWKPKMSRFWQFC